MVVVHLGANVLPGLPIQLGHLDQVPTELTEAGRFLERDYPPRLHHLPLPFGLPSKERLFRLREQHIRRQLERLLGVKCQVEIKHSHQQMAICSQPGNVSTMETDEEVRIPLKEVKVLAPHDFFQNVD